ncbi:very-long-chain 3-oxoacyl-CoA reductase-like [Pelodytes ibericus]
MAVLDCALSSPVFAWFGALSLGYLTLSVAFKLLQGFCAHIVSEWWVTDLRKYGGWAVITGATDGIGKAYAMELAKKGFDVVLISRTMEKLMKVANEIESQTGRKTRVIQADFTRGPEILQSLEEGLKDLDVGILVNNVGMTYSESTARFLEVPDVKKSTVAVINCNIMSMIQMIQIILPCMVERKKGLIINISSEAGTRPYPMITLYSATKAFMDFFSCGLHTEYKSYGVTVQCVMPLMVSTNMTRNVETNRLVKSPESFAREALNTVGYTKRTSGCLSHSLQSYFLHRIFPDFFLQSTMCSDFFEAINKSLEMKFKINKKN